MFLGTMNQFHFYNHQVHGLSPFPAQNHPFSTFMSRPIIPHQKSKSLTLLISAWEMIILVG